MNKYENKLLKKIQKQYSVQRVQQAFLELVKKS